MKNHELKITLLSLILISTLNIQAQIEVSENVPTHNNLYSTLWVQTAAEYQANCLQTYANAKAHLNQAIEDKSWTAAPEQATAENLPPAVILDVDETVLDNSPYQAWLVKADETYNGTTWKLWCEAKEAKALPGVLEFCKYADSQGVTVFYVSNRKADVEEVTRENLKALGFPIKEDLDVVLLKNEKEDWGSKKGTRRIEVAKTHRIIMLFGDNLGDFVENYKSDLSTRTNIIAEHASNWGTKWFMLPNPTYGSWESGLFNHDYSQDSKLRQQMIFESIKPWSGPEE